MPLDHVRLISNSGWSRFLNLILVENGRLNPNIDQPLFSSQAILVNTG